MSSETWSDRLLGGLRQTRERLADNLAGLASVGLSGAGKLTDAQLDDIEDARIA